MGTYQLGRRLVAASGVVESHLGSAEGQWLVLSRLSAPWTQDGAFLERFGEKSRALSAVQSPHVATLLEFGAGGDGFWFAEATGDGEPLRALMTSQAGRLSVGEAVAIADRIAQGLAALHAAPTPVVHADVSASTTFVGSNGRVSVLHSGLAAVAGSHASRGPARSEPHAVAPEQVAGAASPAADVFRLGLLLLEMVTGKSLFVANDPLQVLTNAQRYQGLAAAALQGVPEQLAGVLSWMMHKDPLQRPPASDVVNALQMAASSWGGTTGEAELAQAFRRLMRDRQPPMAARTTELRLTPPKPTTPPPPVPRPSAPAAPGTVIGRIGTRRLSQDELEATKFEEAGVRPSPPTPGRAALLEGALGEQLVRAGRLTPAQLSEAQGRATMLNLALADALVIDGVLDEDAVIEALATITRTTFVSSAQLAQLTKDNAPLSALPQADAERLVAVPLTVKGQALVVAVTDPLEPGVLDAVRAAAPTMTIHLVRSGARALQDTLERLYGAPMQDPDSWLERGPTPGHASTSGITELPLDAGIEVPDDGAALELEGRPAARARSVTVSGLDEGQTKLVELLLRGFGDPGQEGVALVQLTGEVARRMNASTADIDRARFITAAVVATNLLSGQPPFSSPTPARVDELLGPLALPVKGLVPALFAPLKAMPDDLVSLAVVTTLSFASIGGSSCPAPWQPVVTTLRQRRFPTLALEALARALES
ncbi:MAG: protein kinase [Myxococcaceae bacterium]|nr:protein kinase [Myxococcaceae bacterium]